MPKAIWLKRKDPVRSSRLPMSLTTVVVSTKTFTVSEGDTVTFKPVRHRGENILEEHRVGPTGLDIHEGVATKPEPLLTASMGRMP